MRAINLLLLGLFAFLLIQELRSPIAPFSPLIPAGWLTAPLTGIYLTGQRTPHARSVRLLLSAAVAVGLVFFGASIPDQLNLASALFVALAGPAAGIWIAARVEHRTSQLARDSERAETERRHLDLLEELRARLEATEDAATRRHADLLRAVSRPRRRWLW